MTATPPAAILAALAELGGKNGDRLVGRLVAAAAAAKQEQDEQEKVA